eukprot:11184830-Lingulodinium_polyedra.AAC.1
MARAAACGSKVFGRVLDAGQQHIAGLRFGGVCSPGVAGVLGSCPRRRGPKGGQAGVVLRIRILAARVYVGDGGGRR